MLSDPYPYRFVVGQKVITNAQVVLSPCIILHSKTSKSVIHHVHADLFASTFLFIGGSETARTSKFLPRNRHEGTCMESRMDCEKKDNDIDKVKIKTKKKHKTEETNRGL
jgi:hypothetical protein